MKVLFAGQVPKEQLFPEANEDAFALEVEAQRIAVSDGASESFDSRSWAHLLVSRFVKHPEMEANWLNDVVAEYDVLFDPASMSWSKQAAFQRGSFATLLGIEQFRALGTLDVLSVGDSLAVLLEGGDFVDSFPYDTADQFQQRPELFCTNNRFNHFFSSSDFYTRHHKTWTIANRPCPVVLCMTDALGEWALRKSQEGFPVWMLLSEIKEITDLESLVLQERHAGSMRTDDTTLVTLSLTTD